MYVRNKKNPVANVAYAVCYKLTSGKADFRKTISHRNECDSEPDLDHNYIYDYLYRDQRSLSNVKLCLS